MIILYEYSLESVIPLTQTTFFVIIRSFHFHHLRFFMIKRQEQRVAIFIDTQNMYHSAKHLFDARVNFAAVVEAAAADRQIVRVIAYVAKSKTGEEQAFFDALLQSGIELKIKDVQEFASGAKKADWDVGMTVDAIAISGRVDAVGLVTGDGDFVPLVEYLQSHGLLAEVTAFGESTNARLKEVANSFTDLSAEPERFLIGFGRKTNAASPRRKSADTTEEEVPQKGLRKIRVTY